MKIIRFLKSAYEAVKDPNRDFDERIFLVLSFYSELLVLIALIGDVAIKENPYEMIVITATLIFVPIMALVGLYFNRLKAVVKITVVCLVFIIVPGLFFFGGGVKGGGVLWIIFAFMYIGLVLHGTWRNVMFIILAGLTMVFYYVGYRYPWWVYRHSDRVFLYDSFISLILVGALCFLMNWSYGRLFQIGRAHV